MPDLPELAQPGMAGEKWLGSAGGRGRTCGGCGRCSVRTIVVSEKTGSGARDCVLWGWKVRCLVC